MKLLPLFSLILLAWQPALHGQGVGSQQERQGNSALADGLWEVAELHFRQCLADPSLTPEAKSQVAIRLAESLIRGGNPDAALELLGQSFVAKNPEAPFWKAQALAGKHRLAEAIGIFTTLLADRAAPHRTEAGFSQASLQLALGQPDAALETLSQLMAASDAATMGKIQLYQVEILLDLKRIAEAREAMPESEAIAADDRPLAALLEAELLLKEGHLAEAQASFQELLNHSDGLSLTRFHSVAIGLAETIAAQGNAEGAAMSLLAFLQKEFSKIHPEFPLLEPMFQRIIDWLPAKPALTDPILEAFGSDLPDPARRETRWIAPAVFPATLPFDATRTEAVAAWPVYTPPSDVSAISAFAMYARAIGVHRIGTPKSVAEARHLLNRLLLEYPEHLLANRALYQLARWALEAGNVDHAFSLLNTLRDISKSPSLKGEAAFLEARTASLNGDSKLAVQLFHEAATTLAEPQARKARLQAAIARLRGGDFKGITLIQQTGPSSDKTLNADIELERALATTPPAAARTAIEQFLIRFPDHPRAGEARISAIETALGGTEPDLDFAREQLKSVSPESGVTAQRIALAKLRIEDLSNDPAVTATAQSIIDTYPNDPAAAEAALTLGRTLFQAGNYHSARMTLEKLAASDTNSARAQVAWLLAARSASRGGTPQSNEEALKLFDKAIAFKGPLTSVATLERASHLIDMSRLAEASDFLRKWLKTLPENDPLQLPAGLLLGKALYAQGSSNPGSLVEALAVYDKLLDHAKNQPALFNRLQYLRGTTLEQLPDEKNSARKRETQAFEAFHSVLETTTPPAEWEYFELCGFKALALLEKAKRWQAAIAIAQKIASFKGPHAEEAAARASKIQLEQMIW